MTEQKTEALGAYEKAVAKFFIMGTLSEISKTIIFFILFYALELHKEFLIALIFLMAFRIFSGGIHFRKYLHCLAFSLFIFGLVIILGTYILVPKLIGLSLILVCTIPIYIMTPVQAKTRPQATKEVIQKAKMREITVITIFIMVYLTTDTNIYMNIGLWMLIIHTIQLGIAYMRR